MYVNRFNRKRGFDYRRPGMYFVTINLHRHRRLFGKVVDGQMQLNELGQIAATCWQEIPQHFAHVRIDAWVIMPSHVHGILCAWYIRDYTNRCIAVQPHPYNTQNHPGGQRGRGIRHNCRVV